MNRNAVEVSLELTRVEAYWKRCGKLAMAGQSRTGVFEHKVRVGESVATLSVGNAEGE